jgi:Zn-dependent protease with chaperone function
MTPAVLGLLALVLSGPVPSLLRRTTSLRAVPRAAMVLWQATALAAVLAALGASLSLAFDAALGSDPSWADALVVAFAVSVTAVVLVRLLWTGHRVGTRLRSMRRRHRELLDLLTDSGRGDGVRVVPHETPMAYCVPGLRPRVVLSAATLTLLGPAELDAVLGHERGHLRARHDLVLEAFTVLHAAFPRWVSSQAALDEVRLLVEVLADRAAVRQAGTDAMARALVTLAGAATPEAAMGAGSHDVVERLRLLDAEPPRWLAPATLLVAGAMLTLPTVFVAVPWLRGLS